MEQRKKANNKFIIFNGIIIGMLCISILFVTDFDNSISKQLAGVPDTDEYQDLARINSLSQNQAHQIADNIVYITMQMMNKGHNQVQQKLNKELKHTVVSQKLKGLNMMIDPNIIMLIQKLPQVQHLIFEILDSNNNKEVTEQELNKSINGVYHHNENQELIKAFSKELFNKINGGNNFKFEEFKTYFNSFLMELLNGNTNPFENTPPFEKQDIKGLVLYLASERRIWDRCLFTAFKILNVNKDEYVTIDEIGTFLTTISQETWDNARPYVSSILGYMRITGCAYGDKFNLGQLITFGELIRPYMHSILDKYIH